MCSAVIFVVEFGRAALARNFKYDISPCMGFSFVHGQGPFAVRNTIVRDTYLRSCQVSERYAFQHDSICLACVEALSQPLLKI